jgi:hypothetical protein
MRGEIIMANQQPNESNSPIKAGNMGQKPGQNLGQNLGQNAGQKPAQNPGESAGQKAGRNAGQNLGKNADGGHGGVETQPDRAGK